ncbi:MAG TPA: hypothetical protein VFL92_06065 [Sphingomonas sp.]|nr:hypothetical protein [Sphingomonas sp.]
MPVRRGRLGPVPRKDSQGAARMKKLAFVLAAAGLMSVAACHKTPQAENVENAGANAAAMLDNQGDMLSATADNMQNASAASALDNAASNAHNAADAVKGMAGNKADAIENASGK